MGGQCSEAEVLSRPAKREVCCGKLPLVKKQYLPQAQKRREGELHAFRLGYYLGVISYCLNRPSWSSFRSDAADGAVRVAVSFPAASARAAASAPA